jgi:hypothetical protein
MQIRLFRGLGEPVWVNALSSACERLGPDPRRALGPAATPAASTGRTRDRTRPMLQNVRKFLPGRRPHVTQSRTRTPLSHPAEEWSTSYRKKTFRDRKTYTALDRSRGIECATDRVTEPGTAVGMQETYDEEMVRINVAELI